MLVVPSASCPPPLNIRRFADTCLRWAYRGHSMITNRLRCRWARDWTLRNRRRAGPAGELAVAYIVRSIDVQVTLWQFASIAQEGIASLMTKLQNRCASCGGKLGLVCHHYWRLRSAVKPAKHLPAKTTKCSCALLARARPSLAVRGRAPRSFGLAGDDRPVGHSLVSSCARAWWRSYNCPRFPPFAIRRVKSRWLQDVPVVRYCVTG